MGTMTWTKMILIVAGHKLMRIDQENAIKAAKGKRMSTMSVDKFILDLWIVIHL